MDIYHKFRKRHSTSQICGVSNRKNPKLLNISADPLWISCGLDDRTLIKGKEKSSKIVTENSSRSAKKYEKVTIKSAPSDEPYFLRREYSRKPILADICRENASNNGASTMKEEKSTGTIDNIVKEFRDGFNSPSNRSPTHLNKDNYVKRLVAAYEEKFGGQNTLTRGSSTYKPVMPVKTPKSHGNYTNNTGALKTAMIKRIPSVQRAISKDILPVKIPQVPNEGKANVYNLDLIDEGLQSLNTSFRTIIIEDDRKPKDDDYTVKKYFSDLTPQNKKLFDDELRRTNSCMDGPQIVGAYLKEPFKIENTEIIWVPFKDEKLPKRNSLKRMMAKLLKTRKSTSGNSSYASEISFQVEDDNMEVSLVVPSPKPQKRKIDSNLSTQDSKKSKDSCVSPALSSAMPKKSKSSPPLGEIVSNNCPKENKKTPVDVPNATRMVLHEVPREELKNPILCPSYKKILHSTSCYANPRKPEVITIKKQPVNNSVSETSMSEGGSRFFSNLKKFLSFESNSYSPKTVSTSLRRLKYSSSRPKSDALDESKSHYRRFDCVDSIIDSDIYKPASEPTCDKDIVDTFNNLKLNNKSKVYKVSSPIKINERSKSSHCSRVASRPISVSPPLANFDAGARKYRNLYANGGYQYYNNFNYCSI